MPEAGFHPADDWAAFTGSDRRVTVQFYNPATDSFASAVKARGSRDGRRVDEANGQTTTHTVWRVAKLRELTSRPPLRSKINSCGEVWYVVAVDSDPDDKAWTCSCVLGK